MLIECSAGLGLRGIVKGGRRQLPLTCCRERDAKDEEAQTLFVSYYLAPQQKNLLMSGYKVVLAY